MQLDPEQLLAAQQPDVPVLVLAGPGTGKTLALVGRFVHLINSGVDANSILCSRLQKRLQMNLANVFSWRPE